jgi:hypothetical protein
MAIALSTAAAFNVRSGIFDLHCRASVTRGGMLLAENIPVTGGTEEYDASLSVPERVTVTVPRIADGVDWTPVDGATSVLGAYGQRLHVQLGVGIGPDGIEWFDRGEFLIRSADVQADRIEVEAVGLLELIDEARFVSPFQPTGTIVSTLRALIEPALTVMIDTSLIDRDVPTSDINFDEDRLGAVLGLLDAWPAQAQVTPDGFLQVIPAGQLPAGATVVYEHNVDGRPDARAIVITRLGGSSRDGVHNAVVARGTAVDGTQVQGVAYDTGSGAASYTGPFNPLPVPLFFESPLLATTEQCNAAAQTILARERRQSYQRYDVEMVPQPDMLGGDIIALADDVTAFDDLREKYGVIEAMTLPYTPSQPMRLKLRQVFP